jgi:hypothetical protein
MNDELERELGEAPRAAVPEALDRRVEATIRRARPSPSRRVPLWLAAAACAACLLVGFFGRPLLSTRGDRPGAEPAVLFIEAPGTLLDVLKGGGEEPEAPFFERRRAEVRDLLKG